MRGIGIGKPTVTIVSHFFLSLALLSFVTNWAFLEMVGDQSGGGGYTYEIGIVHTCIQY